MRRQRPVVSRPQNRGMTLGAATLRTVYSVVGIPISSQGRRLLIVVLLFIRIVIHRAVHLFDPELIRDDLNRPAEQPVGERSEEHTSELQSLMRNSYAVFCLKNKKTQ